MSMYAKVIGVIVPSAGITIEAAYHRYVPGDVAVATARTKFNQVTYQDLGQMIDRVKYAAEDLCRTDPDVIVFGSMMASCISGDAIRNIVEQHTGIPCITAFESLLQVLDQFGIRRLAIISPFNEELGLLLKSNLLKHGVQECTIHPVRQPDGSPYTSIRALEEIEPDVLLEKARSVDLAGMDALMFDSSGLQIMDHIQTLEQELRLPVLCSDQFTLWNALRTVGYEYHMSKLGSIFE